LGERERRGDGQDSLTGGQTERLPERLPERLTTDTDRETNRQTDSQTEREREREDDDERQGEKPRSTTKEGRDGGHGTVQRGRWSGKRS